MKNLLLLLVVFLVATFPNYSQDTIHIPLDYNTIQAGIDAANNGDIVLIADGLYYENINFIGKAIIVASHFLINGDSTHIENTIIDGSQVTNPDSGSVVYFISGEDTTSILYGLTITGGTGTVAFLYGITRKVGGGIYAYNSSASVKNNIIKFNILEDNSNLLLMGGGICLYSEDTRNFIIENNVIQDNTITGTSNNYVCTGGGIRTESYGYVRIANNKVMNNSITSPYSWGGGISPVDFATDSTEIIIVSNLVSGNTVSSSIDGGSGGIDIISISPMIKNNLIVNNTATKGGGMWIELSIAQMNLRGRISYKNNYDNFKSQFPPATIFENNTIAYNTATIGGGGVYITGSVPQIMNSIIWGNNSPNGSQIFGTADVQYSNVEGGHTGTGNINVNPRFIVNNEYYILEDTSQCIDAGNPDPTYFDIGAGGNALPPAQGSLINDMGHCGGPASLWYLWDWPMPVDEIPATVGDFVLHHNYPNPFNPSTSIKYKIPELSFVTIKIYDVLGNEIETLVNEEKPVGIYELTWYAEGLPSGVYFYRLQAGDFVETKKMVLMK